MQIVKKIACAFALAATPLAIDVYAPSNFGSSAIQAMAKDRSAETYEAAKGFSGVHMQQGAPQVDSDRNARPADVRQLPINRKQESYSGVRLQQGKTQFDSDRGAKPGELKPCGLPCSGRR